MDGRRERWKGRRERAKEGGKHRGGGSIGKDGEREKEGWKEEGKERGK